jgi:iron(III) transport system permease protein
VLPVRTALLNVDPAQEEAARGLGLSRWRVFLCITLPQLRPALAAGALLTALYTLSDFGAVAVMRYNVFTRAIYLQYTSAFNRERAAVLALVLVIITLALLALERYTTANMHNYRIGTGAQRKLSLVALGRWRIPALAFCGTLVGSGVGVPVMMMIYWLTGRTMVETISINIQEMATNTVGVSFVAAIFIGIVAMPLGILATRTTSSFGRWLVGLSYIGNALPGIVIGLTLVFFGIRYLPNLYQTIPLLILGYTLRFLPFSVGATRSALTQVNPRYEEAARSLGLSSWQVTYRITLPLVRTGILGGIALVFLSVMKELPTTLILSPLGFRTFATRIWSVQSEAMYVLIGVPGLLLIGVSALSLVLILGRDQHTTG